MISWEECWVYILRFYRPDSHFHKGKVSSVAGTLGNILLPVPVAHIRPLCYQCHRLHFSWSPTEKLSVWCDFWCFLHAWQLSLFHFSGIIYCFVCLTHLQIVVIFWGWLKRNKDNGVGFLWMLMVGVEGAHDQWQISVLWCCSGHWETSGCVCVTPPSLSLSLPPGPRRSFHDLYCTSSSSYWVVLQENVCHQPLNMCLNDISPVCLWECLRPRDDWTFVSTDKRLLRCDWSDLRCKKKEKKKKLF